MNEDRKVLIQELEPVFDYRYLKGQGLKYIEELAGELWTNFNDSDPGVTVLEQLCYGLTELGYCNDFDIEDILAEKTGQIEFEDQFVLPEKGLTTSPITFRDYRKLVIDRIKDIKNVFFAIDENTSFYHVWIHPGSNVYRDAKLLFQFVEQTISPRCMNSKTFYQNIGAISQQVVEIINSLLVENPNSNIQKNLNELDKFFVGNSANLNWVNGISMSRLRDLRDIANSVLKLVRDVNCTLSGHRNLAEYFTCAGFLIPVDITLKGQIFLNKGVDVDSFAQALDVQLNNYSCSRAKQQGYSELTQSGKHAEAIFDGPELQRGWIDDKDLGKKASSIQQLELVKIVRQSPDVETVSFLEINKVNSKVSTVRLRDYEVAVISQDCQMIQQQKVVKYQKCNSAQLNLKQVQNKQQSESLHGSVDRTPPLPVGEPRNIEEYYSIQNTFPHAYGLGENELPQDASASRKGEINQLKGYLLVFDQLLGNQFSQLANTANLLSYGSYNTQVSEPPKFLGLPTQIHSPTYYSQPLYQVPHVKLLLIGSDSYRYGERIEGDDVNDEAVWKLFKKDPFNQYMIGLRECMEDDIVQVQRQEKFLNHLLARHGCVAELIDSLSLRARWYADIERTRVIVKTLLLQNWRLLSYYRFKSKDYNCLKPIPSIESTWQYYLIESHVFQPWFAKMIDDQICTYHANTRDFKSSIYKEIKANLVQVRRQADDAQIRHQFKKLQSIVSNTHDFGPLFPGEYQYINGQVDQQQLSSAFKFKQEDFEQYSAFELLAELVIGVGDHYQLIIDCLRSLISDIDFLAWLKGENALSAFSQQDEKLYRVENTNDKDTVYIDNEPLITLSSLHQSRPCLMSYLAHLKLVIWLRKHTKGCLLIECVSLFGINGVSTSTSTSLLKQIESIDTVSESKSSVTSRSCYAFLPSFIHFFSLNEEGANTFSRLWDLLLSQSWPAHVEHRLIYTSQQDLSLLVSSYLSWHNDIAINQKGKVSSNLNGAHDDG